MKFGLYIGSAAGTDKDLAVGKPDDPAAIHVQRPVLSKGKAAFRPIDLHRRDSEIREDSVGSRRSRERLVQVSEIRGDEPDAIAEWAKPFRRERERIRVAVDPEKPDFRTRFEKSGGVAARTERRVDEESASRRSEPLDHFGHEDRRVRAISIGFSVHTITVRFTKAASKGRRSPRE